MRIKPQVVSPAHHMAAVVQLSTITTPTAISDIVRHDRYGNRGIRVYADLHEFPGISRIIQIQMKRSGTDGRNGDLLSRLRF